MQPDLLKQLKDVQLPQPISWWPLAPGWYGLFALAFLIALMIFLFYRRRKKRLQRRQRIVYHLQQLTNVAEAMAYIKQVAINCYPNKEVERLQGDAWVSFLAATATLTMSDPLKEQLAQAAYQAAPENSEEMLAVLQSWLEQQKC